MAKRLILNGLVMNSVSHIHHGLWRRDETLQNRVQRALHLDAACQGAGGG